MTDRQPCVYMLASGYNGTLYVGVTAHLPNRVSQHKSGLVQGFTKKYRVHRLVWYELQESMHAAIVREKQLKKWNRAWKIRLIDESNPQWRDLYDALVS